MAALPVPTIPIRLNNFASTALASASIRGITADGRYMCWTGGTNDQILIQPLIFGGNKQDILLEGTVGTYLGTGIGGFQYTNSRANIFVGGDRIWVMRQGTGTVSEWNMKGKLVKILPGPPNIVEDETPGSGVIIDFFAQFGMLRIDPNDNRTVIRSYFYDNTSWCASSVIDRRIFPTEILTFDMSVDNFTTIRIHRSRFSSNAEYGFVPRSNPASITFSYVAGGNNQCFGFLENDIDPEGPVKNEDKVKNLFYGTQEQTGDLPSRRYDYRNSRPGLTPNVQVYTPATQLISFNEKNFVLRPNISPDYIYTRGVNVELLIPKSFIEPFSNSVITPTAGNITTRMFTNGDNFGTIAFASGIPFLFLAAFPANRSIPINNYSLGVGAKSK